VLEEPGFGRWRWCWIMTRDISTMMETMKVWTKILGMDWYSGEVVNIYSSSNFGG